MIHLNVAYTREYKEYQTKYEHIFQEANFNEEKIVRISDKLILSKKYYIVNSNVLMHGTTNCLMDESGTILYSYLCINNKSELSTIIKHSNGNDYYIFNRDLYGYSILDLSTLNTFHYIPYESFFNKEETFIWSNVHYNNINNVIAIDGCYWARPEEIGLARFEEPMNVINCFDLRSQIDKDYLNYDDICFSRWHSNNIIIKCISQDSYVELEISESEYMSWI